MDMYVSLGKPDLEMASGTGRKSGKLCKGGANSISAAVQLAVDAGNSPADLLCPALCEG